LLGPLPFTVLKRRWGSVDRSQREAYIPTRKWIAEFMQGVLADRAVISVSGAEAKTFLQGLVTNDVTRLAPERPLYAALLTPQGKILYDFVLRTADETIYIDCEAVSADALLKRLTLYRLRARVELARRADLSVLWNSQTGFDDPRWPVLGRRGVAPSQGPDVSSAYLDRRLELGVPEGSDFGSDRIFALDGGLEELRGVSFDKGCYIGQELTARMKHRGTARRRLLPISTLDGSDLSLPGSAVRAGSMALGEITTAYGRRGFALIRLDRWEEAEGAAVRIGEQAARIDRPAWLARSAGT
jgi:folate-binding protein YgfZ